MGVGVGPRLGLADSLGSTDGVAVISGDGLAGAKCGLSVSGGVQVDLNGMACDRLDVDASGGAGLKLAGASKQLHLDASGGVQLETRSMSVGKRANHR